MGDKWEDVKKKISGLEQDPFLNEDMLRTLDTISIADYWRRRYEEEHRLAAELVAGKDEELRELRDRLQRQGVDLQVFRQQLDSANAQMTDRQRYWEERYRALEMEHRHTLDRRDWEIKTRVLEEQNKFLAEHGGSRVEPAAPVGPRVTPQEVEAVRAEATREIQSLRGHVDALMAEKRAWEEERVSLQTVLRQAEAAQKTIAELEEKAKSAGAEAAALREERDRLLRQSSPLASELERMRKLLEQREADHFFTLEDLSRGFAHRVRNYLGIMSGTLQLCVANYKMEEELKQQVELVDQNAQEMLKTIEEFLSLARLPDLAFEPVDLKPFMTRALAAFEDKAKAANVKVDWKCPDGLPPAKGEPKLLGEAVAALAQNALEAMPEGGKFEVEAFHSPEERMVGVRFKDTGKGIGDNHIKKVFQPYFTTKKGRKGLGLSICKRVLELHRGRVELTSAKGEGSTFVLFFPIAEGGGEKDV